MLIDRSRQLVQQTALILGGLWLLGCGLPHRSQHPDGSTSDHADVVSEQSIPDVVDADVVCLASETRCNGACVSLTDPRHCGNCANDCTALAGVSGANVHCTAAQCDLTGACVDGRADCDNDPTNGCETDITTSTHCGSCTIACGAAMPLCAAMGSGPGTGYSCATGCPAGTTRCSPSTCSDTTGDPVNCGTCNHQCPVPANAIALCTQSVCDFLCATGFHKCGDGCALDSSVAQCGVACASCSAPANSTATCSGGACGFTCATGFHACNGHCSLDSSPTECGPACLACPVAIGTTATCVSGTCAMSCPAGQHLCTDHCVTDTSLVECGSSCAACTAPAHATATCSASGCDFTCQLPTVRMGMQCVASTTCGNSALDPGETCDDGNHATGDGCDALCLLETPIASDTCTATPLSIHTGTQWYTGTTEGATGTYSCSNGSVGGGPARYYSVTTVNGGAVTVEVVPSATSQPVFASTSRPCPGFEFVCQQATAPGADLTIGNLSATTGATYITIVGSHSAATAGSYQLRITVN